MSGWCGKLELEGFRNKKAIIAVVCTRHDDKSIWREIRRSAPVVSDGRHVVCFPEEVPIRAPFLRVELYEDVPNVKTLLDLKFLCSAQMELSDEVKRTSMLNLSASLYNILRPTKSLGSVRINLESTTDNQPISIIVQSELIFRNSIIPKRPTSGAACDMYFCLSRRTRGGHWKQVYRSEYGEVQSRQSMGRDPVGGKIRISPSTCADENEPCNHSPGDLTRRGSKKEKCLDKYRVSFRRAEVGETHLMSGYDGQVRVEFFYQMRNKCFSLGHTITTLEDLRMMVPGETLCLVDNERVTGTMRLQGIEVAANARFFAFDVSYAHSRCGRFSGSSSQSEFYLRGLVSTPSPQKSSSFR
mmetsp:Transcript_8801/g.26462  ORF Transcript_8801/g.26462 Transcript_8801/m.26462 type:complete len:357 (-) Transcript_8801:191-1261(-)